MARLLAVLIITATTYLVAPCSGTQHSDLPRKWLAVDKRSTQPPLVDPCHKERSMKMICHCVHQPATDHHNLGQSIRAAECWILKNDFTAHDPLWRAFDRYTTITDLKFIVQSGSLNFLPTTVLGKLANLAELSVSFSQIRIIESFALSNSSSLRTVRLNHNNMTGIHRFGFANHQSLERIDLQENEISQIDRDSFFNLTKLEYLALNDNKIAEIPNGTFRQLNNLLELQLQHNRISAIAPDWFLRLENLRILKLSSNKLKSIENGAFIELWSLEELYLDKNEIEKISERAFDGLNNLRRLSLQRNRLKILEKAVFTSLPVIKWLNLSHNQLTTLHKDRFSYILENFMQVDSSLSLSGNDLVCECSLNWLIELRNRSRSTQTQQTIDRLKCHLTDVNNVPEDILLNAIDSADNGEGGAGGDYISDDTEATQVRAVDVREGSLVNLSLLEQLPCHGSDENDPTSLPMPRESTGFRDSGISLQTSSLVTVIIFSALVICTHNNLE